MTQDQKSFLDQSNYETNPTATFPDIGTTYAGVIANEPRLVTNADQNGEVTTKLVVDVDNAVDGKRYAVWIKQGLMGKSVAAACEKAGVDGLAKGGKFALQYDADGQAKPGQNAPKHYVAQYEAPAPSGTNVTNLFGGNEGPAQGGEAAAAAPTGDLFAS